MKDITVRSATEEDSVFLCSPETAAASALAGSIADPRSLRMPYPKLRPRESAGAISSLFEAPIPLEQARTTKLVKGPNIRSLPEFDALPDSLELPILLKMGDDVSTDEIMPAASQTGGTYCDRPLTAAPAASFNP